jgi:Nucleotidyl transferase AbiEii toxin, Type IV TA system
MSSMPPELVQTRTYATPDAFRRPLHDRLMALSDGRIDMFERLRRQVAFERMVVRLAALPAMDDSTWVVKGGLALELRLPVRTRETRDLDLATVEEITDYEEVRQRLARALKVGLDDHFTFEIREGRPLSAAIGDKSGWRFLIETQLADKRYILLRMDVVARSLDMTGAIDEFTFRSALAFANLPAEVTVRGMALEQQAAEKFHAMCQDRGHRKNTRTKDLVDLVLLIELGLLDTVKLAARVRTVFGFRGIDELPAELPSMPEKWRWKYAELVADTDVECRTAEEAHVLVSGLWLECLGA